MRRLLSIRLLHEYGVWHWSDNQGWGTGHSHTRIGAFLKALTGDRTWF